MSVDPPAVAAQLDRPLRIVQAAAFPFPSAQGSQVYVRGMARALARRGHDVTVVCYAHGDGQPDPEYRVLRTPPVPGYQRLRAGPDPVKPFLDVALAARIAAVPADVVHAHNYEAPLAGALARLRTGVPVVYNAHNTMGEELPTYFARPAARRLARVAGRWLDATVPRLADHAIAISPGAVPVLHGLGCRSVSHVPPGVDGAELAPVAPARLGPGPWVVYAGNPDAYQDLDLLIEAMRLVPEAGLLMVSASSLAHWQDCGIERLHLEQTSDFARVRALMAAADVAALPRTVCSGYPIKLLNYLGSGLPSVASAGSAQDLPGVVAVANGDVQGFAHAIRALIHDPVRRRRLSVAAREHVLQACSWDRRAAELEAVYAAVLLGRQRAPRWRTRRPGRYALRR